MKIFLMLMMFAIFLPNTACRENKYRYEEGVKSYLSVLVYDEKKLVEERVLLIDIACNCKQTLLEKIAAYEKKANITLILVGRNKSITDKYSQLPVKKVLTDSNAIAFRYETGLGNPLLFRFKNGEIAEYFYLHEIEQQLMPEN